MNERIVDDLVLKARAIAITDTKDGGKQFNLEVFHRKFAELIVRECADICYNREYTDGSRYGDEIIEHFGVK